MDFSLPGSFIHGIFQARVLEWGAIAFSEMVKRLPAMRETWVRSLGWEDPLEEEMASHSSILVWRIPWREEPGGLDSMGSQKSWT